MAVTPAPIVKDFDVIEDIGARQIASFINALSDTLLFQTAEERLGDGIIPAISTAAHARFKIVGMAETPPIIAAILTALIGMNQYRLCGFAPPHRHQQRIQSQLPRQSRLH